MFDYYVWLEPGNFKKMKKIKRLDVVLKLS